MIAHGRENVLFGCWRNLRPGSALPLSADFCGVEPHHWGLVGAEVSKLGRPHRRWRPRSSRVEAQRAKRVGQFQVGDAMRIRRRPTPTFLRISRYPTANASTEIRIRALVGKPGNSDDLKSTPSTGKVPLRIRAAVTKINVKSTSYADRRRQPADANRRQLSFVSVFCP